MKSERMHGAPAGRIKRLNAKIPVHLEKEDAAIAKRMRKPRIVPLKGLEEVYDLVDRQISYTKGLAPCREGCAYCCHSEVAVSNLEADYIALKTGYPSAPVRKQHFVSEQYCDPDRQCPFLDKSRQACIIYAYRPMMCRTHISLESSNAACQFDGEETIALIDRARSWPGTMEAYLYLVGRHGDIWADIRTYFGTTPVAMKR